MQETKNTPTPTPTPTPTTPDCATCYYAVTPLNLCALKSMRQPCTYKEKKDV